ncbi:cation:dicarboxylate symporter family transporter [Aquicella lusitana]|uniref:Na+/H+-dicarboxylate symporter n=1 Tax=Aquicella lusitana TaxID=254246 RepID=A0A370GJ56_9COXI|nr:cation:dicarboxylase symporter family transporter [Aquicella lusitana]RDI43818.1 hypothetical protein C8D86_11088 [Aquicella lusitana]VVC74451.1 L-cystine uptake protein TcyP [Aquicella lusitana]
MITALFDLVILILSIGLLYALKQQKIQLSLRILLSLGLGVIYGLCLKLLPENGMRMGIESTLHFMGYGYLALLKMLVIPLILTSIIHAILNLGTGNGTVIKKMSFFACGMLLGMTAVASLIGIIIGKLFAVGQGMSLPEIAELPKHNYTGLVDTLLSMLPSNPVAVMAKENTIAVVLFAVLLGLSARMLDKADHDKMETFSQLIASLFAIVKKLAVLVLGLTPYGIFALLSLLLLNQGSGLLTGIINFIAAMYTAMIIVFIMHSVILIFAGYHPWEYLKKASTALFVAFTTRSSFGTLPVTEETLRDKFKTSQVTATFVPSIGATIGMNACAGVFPAMLVVMTLTIMHQPLTWDLVLMIMFINAVASLGISGIPGTAYIAATVTLTSLNLPYAIVALVQGVDPIVDMGRTAVNVNGAITTALVVDRISVPDRQNEFIEITSIEDSPA